MRDAPRLSARLTFALLALLALLGGCRAGCPPTAPYRCTDPVYGVRPGTDVNGNPNQSVTGYQWCGCAAEVPAGFFLPDTTAGGRP